MPVRKSDTHFERRQKYLSTLPEWQNLLEHFELNDQSFAYIPLLLPNDVWARVCEVSLESFLSANGKNLYKIDCQTPDELKNIAVTLFALEIDEDTEAIWIVAPIGSGETFLAGWAAAWREGMARLNQYRNPFREKFPVTILFVGAVWIQEITRNMAPDLWSIRRTVIRVNPEIDFSDETAKKTEPSQSESTFEEGQGVDAEFALQEAARLRGNEGAELSLAGVLYRAAVGFLDQKNYQKALEIVDEVIGIYEKKLTEEIGNGDKNGIEISLSGALFAKGFTLTKLGGSEKEAEENYRQALKLNSNYVDAYNNLGLLLAKDENRLKEAEVMWRKAIEIHPNYVDAYYNLGILLFTDESRWKEAEEMYRKAIEIHPNYANAYNNLGILLAKDESRWKEAEEMYRKMIEINPNDAEAYYNLGNLLAKDESRLAEAEEMYRKVIEINPNDAEAYSNLGWLLAKDENRLKEAEEIYRKAFEINPNYANAYYGLGILLYKLGKIDEAITNFEIAAELDKNFGSPRVSLAGIYRKQGNLKKSKKYADQAKTLIKEDDYYNLACLYSILDDEDEAFRYLKLAVEKDTLLKSFARNEPNFDFIRADARFAEIVGN